MPKQPSKTEQTRIAVLNDLFDGPKTIAVLRKSTGVGGKLIDAMVKAGTVVRIVGGLEITDDGRTLVRIARKKVVQ